MSVLIIGGGVIGLALARELAGGGASVTILDSQAPASEASWAAAGMLVPDSEEHPSAEFQRLCSDSRDLYPEYIADLEKETGLSAGLRTDGVIVIRPSGSVKEAMREPELVWRPALFYPREWSIDNRLLCAALLESCNRRGVVFERAAVAAVEKGQAILKSGERRSADAIVNAAGCWASQIQAPGVKFEVRPVKGQMVAVRAEGWTLRYVIRSEDVYIVPRNDGRVILGATMEEAGYDKTVNQEVIDRFLTAGAALVPKLKNAPVVESWSGLRPATRNGLPILGETKLPGYHLAVGHLRNGILLAPITAKLLSVSILTGQAPPSLQPFRPS